MTPSQPASGQGHLSTLLLHQLRYGELDATADRAARTHLDACGTCRDRHQSQLAFRRAFDLAPPPVRLPQQAHRSWFHRLPTWLRWAPVPLLAAAMALVAVQITATPTVHGIPQPDSTRLKGAADIVVLVQGAGVLDQGEAIHPGDHIQVRLPAGPWSEAWLGDEAALIGHFPMNPDSPTLSPFALTVDGEGDTETLTVILATDPLDQATATQALRGRRMDGVQVRRLSLPKKHQARTK